MSKMKQKEKEKQSLLLSSVPWVPRMGSFSSQGVLLPQGEPDSYRKSVGASSPCPAAMPPRFFPLSARHTLPGARAGSL